jgi:hypothetical protein
MAPVTVFLATKEQLDALAATVAAMGGGSGLGSKQSLSEKDQAGGYAGLDLNGKLLAAQLPAIAVNDTFPVASQAAMLALTAQRGDVAVRTDIGRSFILVADAPATLANWVELVTEGKVSSVNGLTGIVALTAADVGAATTTALASLSSDLDVLDAAAEKTVNKGADDGYAELVAGKVPIARIHSSPVDDLIDGIAREREWDRLSSFFAPGGGGGNSVGIRRERQHITSTDSWYSIFRKLGGELYERVTLECPRGILGGQLVPQVHMVELCRPMVYEPSMDSGGFRTGGRIALAGTWDGVSDARAHNGKYARSNTAGSTATFTVPKGMFGVGLPAPIAPEGGYVSVSLDGSLTAANRCLTAQQYADRGDLDPALLTTGGGSINPTTRLLSNYSRNRGIESAAQYREHVFLADNLDPSTTHTVVLTVLGVRTPYSGNTDNYAYCAGLTLAGTTTTMDSFNADLFRWEAFNTMRESAYEYAIRVRAGTSGPSQTCGSIHGYEYLVSLQIYLDGILQNLVDGDIVWGGRVTVVRDTTIAPPLYFTGDVFSVRTQYDMTPTGPFKISWVRNELQNGQYLFDYTMGTVDGWDFTKARTSDNVGFGIRDVGNDLKQGPFISSWGIAWDPNGSKISAIRVPNLDVSMDNYTNPLYAGLYILNGGQTSGAKHAKWYASRVNSEPDVESTPFLAGGVRRATTEYYHNAVPGADVVMSMES